MSTPTEPQDNGSNAPSDKPRTITAVPNLPAFHKPSEKPGSQMEMVEARFSAIPGQPSIICFEAATDTVVSICPVPQVGLVMQQLNTLNYVCVAHRVGGEFTKEQAAEYIERAANLIDFDALVEEDTNELTFQVALDPDASTADGATVYRAILCVPVSEERFKQNLTLAMLAGKAAARIAGTLAAPATNETTKH